MTRCLDIQTWFDATLVYRFNKCNWEVTIHRPNVSTLLSGGIIRGGLNVATSGCFICSLISCPFFWLGVNRRQVVSRYHHDLPGFQTKALVTSISSDNFRIIPPNCTISKACVLRQSWIFFFAKEDGFLMLLQTYTKLTFGLSDVLVITVMARNRINSVCWLFFRDRILRFGRNMS